MSNVDLNDIIRNVKQPIFDDEMIIKLVNGLNNGNSFYDFIQSQTAITDDNSEINKEEEQELWNKKIPGLNQKDQFRHMGYTGDIGYCMSRLYVNCSKSDLMQLANLFTDKCNSQQLPCYFKYSSGKSHRSDQMVIYSNLKDLSNYIQIMQEIGQEHPEIVQRCGQPPMLTGKIDEWIGIGDEPTPKGRSFTEIRANIIEDVLRKNVPAIEDKEGLTTYITDGLDCNIIREELKKEFKDKGIDIDTLAFNNENLQLYMADEQTRMDYDTQRKRDRDNSINNKKAYLNEQLHIQELKILKSMGFLTTGMEDMIKANSSRYGFLRDMIQQDLEIEIERKFGLPSIRISDEFGVQFAQGGGNYSDLSDEQRQILGSKMMEDVQNYYIKYIDDMMPVMDEKLSRYADLSELPSGNDSHIDIEKADLYSKLNVLAKGNVFFETIGVQNEQIEMVCNRATELLKNIEHQRDDKDKTKMEARRSQIDREYLYEALKGTGITDISELIKVYESQEEVRVSNEDLEKVLKMLSGNGNRMDNNIMNSNETQTRTFSEQEIGKATIDIPVEQKDKAKQMEEFNRDKKENIK